MSTACGPEVTAVALCMPLVVKLARKMLKSSQVNEIFSFIPHQQHSAVPRDELLFGEADLWNLEKFSQSSRPMGTLWQSVSFRDLFETNFDSRKAVHLGTPNAFDSDSDW
ncbi:unnamed protein product [Ceratitis capitata]|uniref:(Mediterranean fruit fly) hypothetical protein n=1 Tax=Ceratitis capitata TaxID=7213 RepID=A0A811V4U3_CERCA|nr:unnamed protein product [Ceratitis capitata]